MPPRSTRGPSRRQVNSSSIASKKRDSRQNPSSQQQRIPFLHPHPGLMEEQKQAESAPIEYQFDEITRTLEYRMKSKMLVATHIVTGKPKHSRTIELEPLSELARARIAKFLHDRSVRLEMQSSDRELNQPSGKSQDDDDDLQDASKNEDAIPSDSHEDGNLEDLDVDIEDDPEPDPDDMINKLEKELADILRQKEYYVNLLKAHVIKSERQKSAAMMPGTPVINSHGNPFQSPLQSSANLTLESPLPPRDQSQDIKAEPTHETPRGSTIEEVGIEKSPNPEGLAPASIRSPPMERQTLSTPQRVPETQFFGSTPGSQDLNQNQVSFDQRERRRSRSPIRDPDFYPRRNYNGDRGYYNYQPNHNSYHSPHYGHGRGSSRYGPPYNGPYQSSRGGRPNVWDDRRGGRNLRYGGQGGI
eukprot:TRINITY_DN8542_c0_g1_i3.p1 TRINITY_DN8542_c0_g1~~TRINITY_DN8542_c0_g1_i3.p1  ORF type:complete len:416 (-),score=78.05 TRINITY_DN8542_c0_g1_i3:396-1643(-)